MRNPAEGMFDVTSRRGFEIGLRAGFEIGYAAGFEIGYAGGGSVEMGAVGHDRAGFEIG